MVKVSVIIPIYNKEKYIRNTIESVLNQTFTEFEVLLIDDGSTDKSKDVITPYLENDARLKYHYHKNMGVSATRNKGIDMALGEYISFLDADDIWMPDFLEKMYNKIQEQTTVYCGTYIIQNQELTKKKISFKEGDLVEHYLKNKMKPPTNCWLIKKSFLDYHAIRFPEDLKWGEDSTFFVKVLIHDKNVKCVKEYLSAYNRDVSENLSVDSLEKIEEDLLWLERLMHYIAENVEEKKNVKKYNKIIETYNIPGTILYRIHSNLNKLTIEEKKNVINRYKKYIDNISFSNGLRSIKLILLKHKILIEI